jgi:CheY-like chemotaxis protein
LRQVVINLVGNAIKFTEHGEVVVRVERESQTDDEVTLKFAVADTGMGIPADKQQKLFQAFSQVDASTTRRHGGTGLGLTISRQLAQRMGGQIWLESELGSGSTFYFTARFGLSAEPMQRRLPTEVTRLRGLPVLAVDDNATNLRVLQGMLTHWAMKPSVASSGKQALAMLQQAQQASEPFALVLLDNMMPEMDGLEATAAIRAKECSTGRHVPIIAMTAAAMKGDRKRCLQAGMDNDVSKPLQPNDLFDIIERLAAGLNISRSTPAESSVPSSGGTQPGGQP